MVSVDVDVELPGQMFTPGAVILRSTTAASTTSLTTTPTTSSEGSSSQLSDSSEGCRKDLVFLGSIDSGDLSLVHLGQERLEIIGYPRDELNKLRVAT